MTTAGYIAPRFGAIGELFDEVVASQPAGGAAFSVFVDGECVVDIHDGEARPGVAWDDTTLSLIFSNTKGLISVATATLIESGALNPDAAVSDYWPEFAVVSCDLTVRGLFEQRAGLSAVRRDMTLAEVFDHDAVIRALLTQETLWEPGTGYAYHSITFGNLVDELIRRVDGRTVSQLFHDKVVTPLGVEAWIGTPADQLPRVAEFVEADWPLTPLWTVGVGRTGTVSRTRIRSDARMRSTISATQLDVVRSRRFRRAGGFRRCRTSREFRFRYQLPHRWEKRALALEESGARGPDGTPKGLTQLRLNGTIYT